MKVNVPPPGQSVFAIVTMTWVDCPGANVPLSCENVIPGDNDWVCQGAFEGLLASDVNVNTHVQLPFCEQ